MEYHFRESIKIKGRKVILWSKDDTCYCNTCKSLRSCTSSAETYKLMCKLGYTENKQTKDQCIQAVTHDPMNLSWVVNQTEEICLAAMKSGVCAFHYVEDKTPAICTLALDPDMYPKPDPSEWMENMYHPILEMLEQSNYNEIVKVAPYSIQYIEKPSIELIKLAVNSHGKLILLFDYPSDEIVWAALKSNVEVFEYITEHQRCKSKYKFNDPTNEMIDYVLSVDGTMIRYVNIKTHARCLAAVTNTYKALDNIESGMMSENIIWAAIKQKPSCLSYSFCPTEEMIEYVLAKSPLNIRYVFKKYQTPEICERVISENPYALLGAEHVDSETRKELLAKHPSLLSDCKNQLFYDHDLIMIAIKAHWSAIRFVGNYIISDEMRKTAIDQNGMALKFINHKNVPEKFIIQGLSTSPFAYERSMKAHKNLVPREIRTIINKRKATIEQVYKWPWAVEYCKDFKDYEWLFSTEIDTCILFNDKHILATAAKINPRALDIMDPCHHIKVFKELEKTKRFASTKRAI